MLRGPTGTGYPKRVLPINTFHSLAAWTGLAVIALAPAHAAELREQIDREIAAIAGGPLAARADDSEFLRRVWLDLAGGIPTSTEARAFLEETAADKRAKLIERLLAGEDWPRRAEQAVSVMLLERRTGGKVPDAAWRDWLRGKFAANRPWDEIVRELLVFSGDPKSAPTAKFLADGEKFDHDRATQDIARLFLGMNVQCAQCHDHPTIDAFTQADYAGIAAFLRSTALVEDKKAKAQVLADTPPAEATMEFKSVFKKASHRTAPRVPGGGEVVVTVFAKGDEFATPAADGAPGVPKFLARPLLARELTAPENARFARNAVNRFWHLFMGRGLVHPLDQMHEANPASHPVLLDAMAREFAAHAYDVRWLVREIALSEAYQRSSRGPAAPEASYRRANVRGLSAEQLAAALLRAVGALEAVRAAPVGKFDVKKYVNALGAEPPSGLDATLALFSATFGSPPGEPEVEFAPGAAQTLFLANERLVLDWLKPFASRLAKLESPDALGDELYLSIFTRRPTAPEREEIAAHLAKNKDHREVALGELAWALIASAEFRLNH